MYYVELGFIGNLVMAIFIIGCIVMYVRDHRTDSRPMTDEEYKASCENRDRRCREFFAQYKKDHPEIWDENGNMR